MCGAFFIIRIPAGCPCHSQSSVAFMLDRFWTGIDQDQIHLTDRTAGIDRNLLSGFGRNSPCVALHGVARFCVCRRSTVRCQVMQTDEVLTTESCVYDHVMS